MNRFRITSRVRLFKISGILIIEAAFLRRDARSTAAEPAGSAAAPLVTRGRVALNLAGAELILTRSRAKAAEMNLKLNISIVDDGGHPLAFARMDGARPASAYTAMTKAVTAAT